MKLEPEESKRDPPICYTPASPKEESGEDTDVPLNVYNSIQSLVGVGKRQASPGTFEVESKKSKLEGNNSRDREAWVCV